MKFKEQHLKTNTVTRKEAQNLVLFIINYKKYH